MKLGGIPCNIAWESVNNTCMGKGVHYLGKLTKTYRGDFLFLWGGGGKLFYVVLGDVDKNKQFCGGGRKITFIKFMGVKIHIHL